MFTETGWKLTITKVIRKLREEFDKIVEIKVKFGAIPGIDIEELSIEIAIIGEIIKTMP